MTATLAPAAERTDAPTRRRSLLVLGMVVCVAALLVVVVLSIGVGARNLSPAEVWSALVGDGDAKAELIVRHLRVPRTFAGLLVGAALGLAGALMQALTRNPLADPGLLGVEAGASAAIVCGIAYAGVAEPGGYVWFALLGAGAATVVVYLLGSTGRRAASPCGWCSPARRSAPYSPASPPPWCSATASPSRASGPGRSARWRGSPPTRSGRCCRSSSSGSRLALALGPALNAIALGDQLAAALGAKVTRTRVLGILATTLLCGAATAVAGPVAFIGLLVPHAVRPFTGPDNRWLLPFSMIAGAILVLGSDVLGRVLLWPSELEVSVVTVVIGAPVFILIVRRRRLAQL